MACRPPIKHSNCSFRYRASDAGARKPVTGHHVSGCLKLEVSVLETRCLPLSNSTPAAQASLALRMTCSARGRRSARSASSRSRLICYPIKTYPRGLHTGRKSLPGTKSYPVCKTRSLDESMSGVGSSFSSQLQAFCVETHTHDTSWSVYTPEKEKKLRSRGDNKETRLWLTGSDTKLRWRCLGRRARSQGRC
jgi:hypothetical protein